MLPFQPILVVEDNARIRAHIVSILMKAGYAAYDSADAGAFWSEARRRDHALYLVDIGLPDADGTELIYEIRQGGDNTPILVLSAKAGLDTKLAGLTNGADDYLTKPFHPRELVARIQALLRRAAVASGPQTLALGRLRLDAATNDVHAGEVRLSLSRGEGAALRHLLRQANRTVTRDALRGAIYRGTEMSENAIDKTISRLRQTLADSDCGVRLVTLKGTGYMLTEQCHE